MPPLKVKKYCRFFAIVFMAWLVACCGSDLCAQKPSEIYREAGQCGAIGGRNYSVGRFDRGLPYFQRAMELFMSVKDTAKIIECCQSLGVGFQMINQSDSSLYYYNRALDLSEKSKDAHNLASCYLWLGTEAYNRAFGNLAKEYYEKILPLDSVVDDDGLFSQAYCRLGLVYVDYADSSESKAYIQKAYDYTKESLRLQEKSNFTSVSGLDAKVGLSMVYIYMAKFYNEPLYADSCIHYYNLSLKSEGFGNFSHAISSQVYVKYLTYIGKYKEALDFMQDESSFFNQSKIHAFAYHMNISSLYERLGDYKEALNHCRIANELQRQINSERNTRAVAKAEAEKSTAIEHANYEAAEAERKQLSTLIVALVLIMTLGTILILVLFRMARTQKRSNKELSEINTQLNSQKDEIAAQKDVIISQMKEVEEVNDKLFSSIDYARRIQRATIPSLSDIRKLFPDSFLFFNPRDMVSGDFYRAVRCGRYSVMVIADCTGHGIPGAFLSMLGISGLKEYCSTEEDAANPGMVLDKMRKFIKSSLSSREAGFLDDGMDMTFCSFDMEGMKLHYATANQVAYIVRYGKIIKLKGDNMPIGYYVREKEHFMTLTTDLMKGDMLYMFSDGIQDQIGGPKQKRFMRERLLNLLSEIAMESCEDQYEILEDKILEWKGDNIQVDDMTLIGIRV